MTTLNETLVLLFAMLVFPGGVFLLANGLIYDWVDRKLVARLQNRVGPPWYQTAADVVKLMAKEELWPEGANPWLFAGLPVVALAGVLTAALYVPAVGLAPRFSFHGDLIVTIYLLSLLPLCIGIAGMNTHNPFSLIGATRLLMQRFAYESPFLLALLTPAFAAGSWQVSAIVSEGQWLAFSLPIGFAVALISLMGKLEMPPFDAPEAETEIVCGALTEYSGRGLALFTLARKTELVVGLTLIAALYLGGLANPVDYLLKTLLLLLVVVALQTLFTRLRIDQTVKLWWRYGVLLALLQWLLLSGGF